MPSYRVTLTIGMLAEGVLPQDVVPRAASAAAELAVVEAQDVQLVRGVPRVVVRYTAEDDGVAIRIADHVTMSMRAAAEIREDRVTRRDGGRWVGVA